MSSKRSDFRFRPGVFAPWRFTPRSAELALALCACGAGAEKPAPEPRPQPASETAAPAEKADLIRVDSPLPGALVQSPLLVTGQARGTWYFEASFPVALLDANGNEVVQHYAQAQGEWMTESFVPFRSELRFSPPATATGTLLLEKDNPSGLPEHADELRVPVRFR